MMMFRQHLCNRNAGLLFGLALLAFGWACREWAFAQEKARWLASGTKTASEVKAEEFVWEGKPTGKVAIYFSGDTAGTRQFVTGRFELAPGLEPHPIHKHPEEEILIVTQGQGEISCDGKSVPVGPGAVMYSGPEVPHGIKNTGKEPLTFYFVKWIGTGPRTGK